MTRWREKFDVLIPHHPGWGKSERPQWLRQLRDIAAIYSWLLAELGVSDVSLVGLGFGGWIAAEMASQAPTAYTRLVLVGAMGIKPPEGDIADQAIVSYIDYPQAGFHIEAAFARVYGDVRRTSSSRGTSAAKWFPHRVEAVHVQPDAAASARRRAHAGPGDLGRRRQARADQCRRCLREGAAQCAAGDRRQPAGTMSNGEAGRAGQTRRRHSSTRTEATQAGERHAHDVFHRTADGRLRREGGA